MGCVGPDIRGWRTSPSPASCTPRNRWYDPHLRIWASPDPLGYVDSYDLWLYAGGDPLNGFDPFGLETLSSLADQHGALSNDDQARGHCRGVGSGDYLYCPIHNANIYLWATAADIGAMALNSYIYWNNAFIYNHLGQPIPYVDPRPSERIIADNIDNIESYERQARLHDTLDGVGGFFSAGLTWADNFARGLDDLSGLDDVTPSSRSNAPNTRSSAGTQPDVSVPTTSTADESVGGTVVADAGGLSERFAAYQRWRSQRNIDGPVTRDSFENFRRGNAGRNGGGFYEARASSGFAEWSQRLSMTHGNTAGDQLAFLYQRFDSQGNFLKWGITQDLATRYSVGTLDGGFLIQYSSGPRRQMLLLERELVETQPGPLNFEPWAGARSSQ